MFPICLHVILFSGKAFPTEKLASRGAVLYSDL